ncbi:spermatogenesis-associated serine-rich protein 1 isoform X2 [Ascaphus truei]|uniref:spermatogenesis-associated serine-rich protein 1 isoform X2 n=1 Tax=Ascaphus truei TaxID=8439 RepID=UPI003F591AC3
MVSSDVMAELDKRPLQKAVDQDCKVLLQHDWGSRSSMKSNGWHYTPQWECEEESYLPPIQCTMPSYPNCDLDWKPTSRWLPSPQYSDAPFPHIKDNKFPDGIRLLRSSPVYDPRNGIPAATPGDNSFRTPEYSLNFHKFGSTRPVVTFWKPYEAKADTFIPLQKLPKTPCVPYTIKEQKRRMEYEKKEVRALSKWKPSPRLFLLDIPCNAQKTKTV